VHGNLIEQVEKTIELLFTKYIKAIISYEGIHRVETYEYPKEAVREALLNAIAHKDYSGLTPIQIRVYRDKLMIWNEGTLPENWTLEKLLQSHSSRPYNPDIANAFFRCGYVESWGRGVRIMAELCEAQGLPQPFYNIDGSDFWIEFRDLFNEKELKHKGLNERQIKAVLYVKEKEKITNKEYMELNGISNRTATYELKELVERYNLLKQLGSSINTYYELT
jgi:ATP-dependent DNA helicase